MMKSEGFQSPNHTQVPNDFFDMIADMDESELKTTLIMIRQTFGFHREGFRMGIGKLAKKTGMSDNSVKAGAKAAEERGTFKRLNPDAKTEAEWGLVVDGSTIDPPESGSTIDPVGGQPLTHSGSTIDPQSPLQRKNKETKKVALSSKELAQANAQVDAMIEAGRKMKYTNREMIPEVYLPFCDVFVEETGLKPTKRVINDWIASFSDYLSEAISPEHLRQACKQANFTVTRPGSLTGLAAAIAAKPASARQPVIVRATEEDQKVTPAPSWVREKAEQRRAMLAAQQAER